MWYFPVRFALVLLLCASCTAAGAQLNYTVSGGAQGFTPIGAVPSNQTVDLTAATDSGAIAPAGFSFPFEGTTYNEFRIWRVGALTLGPLQTPAVSSVPGADSRRSRVLGVYQAALSYTGSSSVAWDFSGGVLTVEWAGMEDLSFPPSAGAPAVSTFQAILDTSTGEIEYRYGPRTGPSYQPTNYDYAVAVAGTATSNGLITVPGSLNGSVDSNGRITAWPTDSYIAFTPTGLSRSAPTISVEENLNPVAFEDVIDVVSGDSVASMNLSILIGDPDGDPVAVTANTMSSEWTQSEFESTTAAVPYALMPSSGTLTSVGAHAIILTLDDGLDARRLFFFIVQVHSTSTPGSATTGSNAGDQAAEIAATVLVAGLHACSVHPAARGGLFLLLLAALMGGVGVLRHRCQLRNSA